MILLDDNFASIVTGVEEGKCKACIHLCHSKLFIYRFVDSAISWCSGKVRCCCSHGPQCDPSAPLLLHNHVCSSVSCYTELLHVSKTISVWIYLFYFIYLFAQKTTIIIAVTEVPVRELEKKANKLAHTIAHYRPLRNNTSKLACISQNTEKSVLWQ